MIQIEQLRKDGARPRVHGNGFIQLDLTEMTRLHIWGHRDIPSQRTFTPIHDHLFGFTSQIIVGRMVNVIYDFHPRPGALGSFRVFQAECRDREDTILAPTGRTGDLGIRTVDHVMAQGGPSSYIMEPHVFHETFPAEPSATVIRKTSLTQAQGAPGQPRIPVPHDRDPDNSFNRYDCLSAEDGWRIIEEVLGDKCDLNLDDSVFDDPCPKCGTQLTAKMSGVVCPNPDCDYWSCY